MYASTSRPQAERNPCRRETGTPPSLLFSTRCSFYRRTTYLFELLTIDGFEQSNRQEASGVAFGRVGDDDSPPPPHRVAIDLDSTGDRSHLQYSGGRDEILSNVPGPHAKSISMGGSGLL